MDNRDLIARMERLEKQMARMQQVQRGIDSTTHGWDGGHLRLYRLTAIEDVVVGGDLTVAGDVTLTGSIAQDAWIAPTLLNSWVDYGAGNQPASYMKDKEGRVHLRGVIKDGTTVGGTAFFFLPAGYRPLLIEIFPVSNNGTFGIINVLPNGQVEASVVGSSAWLSLAGISFSTF